MKPLTKEYIIKNSKPHGMDLNGIESYKNARQYTEKVGHKLDLHRGDFWEQTIVEPKSVL